MEFRCRLGTPGGEIIEGVYVADSEDRLRREFEEKGLYVLAIRRAGRLAFGSLAPAGDRPTPAPPRDARSARPPG
jgi:type II secretory pathway component PulF